MKKFVKSFLEVINESSDEGFRGELVDEFLRDLKLIFELCPNMEKIHYPADIHGHASHEVRFEIPGKNVVKPDTYDSAYEKISTELKKISDFYDSYYKEDQKKIVSFYIWSVDVDDLRYGELEKILGTMGGSGKSQDINVPLLIQLLQEKPEIAEKVKKISISLDSTGSRDFGKAMSAGEHGPLD